MTRTMGSMVVDDVPVRVCRARRRMEAVFPVDGRHDEARSCWTGRDWSVRLYNDFNPSPRTVNLRSIGPKYPVPERLRIEQQHYVY